MKKLAFGKAVSSLFFMAVFFSSSVNAEVYAHPAGYTWLTEFVARVFFNHGEKPEALSADAGLLQDEEISLDTWR